MAARKADAWNTLGGQPMRGRGTAAVALDEAVAATRGRVAMLEEACQRTGRHPDSIRRMLLAYRVSPELFDSADAFTDYVGQYREAGIDEFVFYWPIDPQTAQRAPRHEQGLERIAGDVIPKLRVAA
jgi:alkanesulfonate monooxygenase SsuD/methylene tetrahydromethanopterin reductase-like flavin-dependent oxidoreductase (luciferase family)